MTTHTDEREMREAFEQKHDMLALEWNPLGFYEDTRTQAYWEGAIWAWQAARSAAQSAGQEAVCWAVYNGWCIQEFFKSKEKASEYASEMQKRHDLSGSLPAFVVKPLYAAPTPMQAPEGWKLVPETPTDAMLDAAYEALAAIGDYAHARSSGPAVPDALWEIRSMAYDAVAPAIAAAPTPPQQTRSEKEEFYRTVSDSIKRMKAGEVPTSYADLLVEDALEDARNKALEEAAAIADKHCYPLGFSVAAGMIRGLKTKD
jgi:hypothetical protein